MYNMYIHYVQLQILPLLSDQPLQTQFPSIARLAHHLNPLD